MCVFYFLFVPILNVTQTVVHANVTNIASCTRRSFAQHVGVDDMSDEFRLFAVR